MSFKNKIILAALVVLSPATYAQNQLSGAGSSAAEILYTSMAAAYSKYAQVGVSYQSSSSTEGLQQVKSRKVDFGATDVFLSTDERKASKLLCFPTAVSGIVPIVNVPGVASGQLKLTGELLADIFSRKITKWNDPKVQALNPGLALPALPITVVTRQDSSGTTFNFTDYLSKSSPDWKAAFGSNYSIAWAAGTTPVKGSASVVAALKQTAGTIGYVDYQYVTRNKLNFAMLKNRDGKFVAPTGAGFSSAMNNSGWATKGAYEEMLTDKPGAGSWPITASTFAIVPLVSSKPDNTVAAIKFFTWGFVHGDDAVGNTAFVRLPDNVQGRIFGELTTITDTAGAPLKWSLADMLKMR
ncbi:phosphate ABC transporter substrate-binding protein PstS [Massilia pseudoviolaceinigra]|uniref:phosphate ABC transporter substrate-binding protein PstS n=1 Tax=Massilia pseudoviolaceinigra TaxID=3057165 RepID=UPI0027964619|nr:phosphate ABC transporter substrate-binding protein PstS [Massilia sp. CCM 9206]MDQ1919315.1 phosphate ABC transporter substrate-binding protein PstS [Massilia sp. CCM 9206]